jgi:tetratricopeptide (TPR) repeat protein
MPQKNCFVVMGFGKKTDYATGRVLDLDKSYRNIIKPAAEEAGLVCKRADEIVHSGTIDVPMFEQLLTADVVIADVSTSNPNAFYELGVRHALRPYTTITMAEDKMVFPFDISHMAIQKYHHLGEDIGYDEAVRMKAVLKAAILTILDNPRNDSPVYTFFADLEPPMRKIIVQAVAQASPAASFSVAPTPPAAADGPTQTISELLKQADAALQSSDFITAKSLLKVVRGLAPKDPFVAQKLALATYKSKSPTPAQALEEAAAILSDLKPETSTDTETLGLWGAVHKRVWDLTGQRANLDGAIFGYEKGFSLKNDYWNGINLAFLYNVRAAASTGREAIADQVLAERTRRNVLAICEATLHGEAAGGPLPEKYWLFATMAEAWLGLGDKQKADDYLAKALAVVPKPGDWMVESTREQLEKLSKILI